MPVTEDFDIRRRYDLSNPNSFVEIMQKLEAGRLSKITDLEERWEGLKTGKDLGKLRPFAREIAATLLKDVEIRSIARSLSELLTGCVFFKEHQTGAEPADAMELHARIETFDDKLTAGTNIPKNKARAGELRNLAALTDDELLGNESRFGKLIDLRAKIGEGLSLLRFVQEDLFSREFAALVVPMTTAESPAPDPADTKTPRLPGRSN